MCWTNRGQRGLQSVHATVVAIAAFAVLVAGCRSESITDQARRTADPRALEFLVDAQQFFEAGFYNNALVLVDSAGARAPRLADVPFLRGRILSAMRQFDPAVLEYRATLDLDREYPGVYYNLGNVEYQRGQPEAALRMYRKESAVAAGSVDYLVQLGRAYADVGVVDSARWAYERAIEADSANPTAYMWLGQLLEDQGSMQEALKYSRKGRSLRPDNMNYAYVVGVQQLRSEDFKGAAETLELVTNGMPWHYAAHYNLGQALLGLGESERGARYLARADTLLGIQREITRWENLLASNSHEPMLWVNYGNALRTAGRIDDAIHALSVAYSLNPEWLELQNNIANLMLARGDTLGAVSRYEDLLAIDSTLSDIWLNLGTVYALSGDYTGAGDAWRTALRHDPDHAEARQYLSQLEQQ